MRHVLASLLCTIGLFIAGPALAQQVTFNIEDSMTVRELEFDLRTQIIVTAAGETRLSLDTLLDLRDLQDQMPGLLTGSPVVDGCGVQAELISLNVSAADRDVTLTGELQADFFECNRVEGSSFQRGALRLSIDLTFLSTATTQIEDNCFVFVNRDLRISPARRDEDAQPRSDEIESARLLILEALNIFFAETPFCPELPTQLAALDPVITAGRPREIGDGGVGISLQGTVDVSTDTILDIVRVLQDEGVVPGPP